MKQCSRGEEQDLYRKRHKSNKYVCMYTSLYIFFSDKEVDCDKPRVSCEYIIADLKVHTRTYIELEWSSVELIHQTGRN